MTSRKRQHIRRGTVSPPEVDHLYRSLPDELQKLLYDLMPYAGQLPTELWDRVRHLLLGLMKEAGVPMDVVHRMRWQVMSEAIERVGWDEAPEVAARDLANTCAAGKEAGILASYTKIQTELSGGRRQRRPWRRRISP